MNIKHPKSHHYSDTEAVFQTSTAVHKLQCLLAELPVTAATETSQCRSAQNSGRTTQTNEAMSADESDYTRPRNTSIIT